MNEAAQILTTFPQLERRQRRVLGVLIEKGMTTPEYYPLTLKALVAGCNQKSNRDPVAQLNEDSVLEALDSLQEMGLTGTVHTDGGRAERYRHYVRHKFEISEPQIAILGELLLRGKQQLGELRSRSGRMTSIDSLNQLREELNGMMQMDAVRASGDLQRRGIEVDHGLYLDSESESHFGVSMAASPPSSQEPPVTDLNTRSEPSPELPSASVAASHNIDYEALSSTVNELERSQQSWQEENRQLREQVGQLEETMRELADQLDDLKRQLGV